MMRNAGIVFANAKPFLSRRCVFTMILASLSGGIFEIYGTFLEYVIWFMYGGIILAVIGICLTIFAAKHTL